LRATPLFASYPVAPREGWSLKYARAKKARASSEP
jgi:hypothetical protein